MAEAKTKKMDKDLRKILMIVRTVFCIPIIALLIAGIFTCWRDVHNIRVSSDPLTPIQIKLINALNIEAPANESEWNATGASEDGILVQYGIINNCNFQSEGYQKCEVPKNVGFVGDTTIVALLCVALAFCIITIILSIVHFYYPNTCINLALQFTPLNAALCICVAFITFFIYQDKSYIYHEHYTTVSFPLKITFNAGIYVTCVAFFLILIMTFVSHGVVVYSLYLYFQQKRTKETTPTSNPPVIV